MLPKWNYDRDYNVLTYRIPPLNILSLIFLPCILKRSRKLNVILESIYFTPPFYFTVFSVIIIDLILFPVAWILLIYEAFSQKRRRCCSFLKVIIFPIIILPYTLVDMFAAGLKLISKPYILLEQDDIKTNRLLVKSDLLVLRNILQRDYKTEQEAIPLF